MRRLPLRALTALLLILPIAACGPRDQALDTLRLNQVRMLGSHNSYRPFPSPAEEAHIKAIAADYWPGLDYGHPPLESQLALGLQQFEIDVAPDPSGGRYAEPYASATPEKQALMAAPGAKVLHFPRVDTETHCLTFRKCLGIFARWSEAHPGHLPIVILVNSVDFPPVPGLWTENALFDQSTIDELNEEIERAIGRDHILTPDSVRGDHATLREAALAGAWPAISALRGRFIFVLDGNDAHEAFLRNGHPSLRGRAMFGWFDEAEPEAAFFNIQDPLVEQDRIRALIGRGFMVRTRADADVVEAITRDGRRMTAALTSGAQIVSSDFYEGVPDPEGFGYVADFRGAKLRCDEVVTSCPESTR